MGKETDVKKVAVVTAVVAAHALIAAVFIGIQGCGTTRQAQAPNRPPEPILPQAEPTVAPAPVRSAASIAAAIPGATTAYVVHPGDTLSGIALRFKLKLAEILAVNRGLDPSKLRVGQRILLPGKHDIAATPAPARVRAAGTPVDKPAPLADAAGVYVVKAGDTLSKIASANGVTVDALMRANGLASANLIRIGQKLSIPSGSAAPVAVAESQRVPAESPAPAAARTPAAPVTPPVPVAEPVAPPVIPPAPAQGAVVPPEPMDVIEGAAPPPPQAAAEEAPVRIHVVQEGEDLYTIGVEYGVGVQRLMQLNGLTDTALTSGQRLKIPLSE